MRRPLALLTACAVLVAGCTGGGPTFLSLAQAAPDILRADLSPAGTLTAIDGTMTMTMRMSMEGREIAMPMEMEFRQDLHAGDVTHVEMGMTATIEGEAMAVTMHVVCTPATLHIWMEGLPPESEEAERDRRLDNPRGTCSTATPMADRLMGEIDPETLSMLKQMGGPDFANLRFQKIESESGQDIAVYEMSMDMDQTGMDLNMTMVSKATLSGERISHMDVTGSADMSLGPQGSMRMDMAGSYDFAYGTRVPLPAHLA